MSKRTDGGGSGIIGASGGSRFEKDATEFAKEIMNEHKVTERRETQKELKEFFKDSLEKNGIKVNNETGEPIVKKEIEEKAQRLAKNIADRIIVKNEDAINTYNDLKRELLDTPIYISPVDAQQIPDFNDWRRHHMNDIKLTTQKTSIITDPKTKHKDYVKNNLGVEDVYKELARRGYIEYDAHIEVSGQLKSIVGLIENARNNRFAKLSDVHSNSTQSILSDLYAYSYTLNTSHSTGKKGRNKK